jgi:hypothetical protein
MFYFLTLAQNAFSQPKSHGKLEASVETDSNLTTSLSAVHDIPDTYLYYFEQAIASYPELRGIRISMRTAQIKTTANARPSIGSILFKKRAKRHYVIRMNHSPKEGKIGFDQLDTSARIGLLGHEIGHILDYHKGRPGKVLARGFSYFTKKTKAKFEREIDQLTIERGLGIPLYHFAYYVHYESDASEKYKAFKRAIYLTPEEIIQLIQQLNSQ